MSELNLVARMRMLAKWLDSRELTRYAAKVNDFANEVKSIQKESEWICVDDYKDMPIGTWQVALLNMREEVEIHIAVVNTNITIVGGHFSFDRKGLFAYTKAADLPKPTK